jgi:hypothetical protein
MLRHVLWMVHGVRRTMCLTHTVRVMHIPGMTLTDFLTANHIKDGDFALLVDTDRSTISKVRRGKLVPSFHLLEKIASATGGAVMPNDFLSNQAAHAPEDAA